MAKQSSAVVAEKGWLVDLYYAYQAGRAGPESQYVHYAAAKYDRRQPAAGRPRLAVERAPALAEGPPSSKVVSRFSTSQCWA
jgi:hypothetical protein